MRLLESILFLLMTIFLSWGSMVYADVETAKDSAKSEDSDDLELVPLVNPDAPLVIVWTSENDDVSIEDATAIDSQLFEDMGSRRDIRLFSRKKTLSIVDESGDKRLMHCKWADPCLVGIGKHAKADMVLGVKLTGTKEQYFLAFKLIALGDKPGKVIKFTSGKLSELLVGGIAKAVESVLKAKATPMKKPPPLPPKKAQAPNALNPLKHSAAQQAPAQQKKQFPPKSTDTAITSLPQTPKAKIVPPRPVDEVEKRPEPPGFFSRHLGSSIATGLGIAFAGAAIGFGVEAADAKDKIEFQWDPAVDDSGRSNALTANILFGLSGLSIIVAVVLFVIEPSADDYTLSFNSDGAAAGFRF